MNRKKRSQIITSILDRLFPDPQISLDFEDPYTLLIATLLSAQCTDQKVNQVTPALFRRAKNPEAMQNVPLEDLGKLIQPCGLFRFKAKAIRDLSKKIVEDFGGKVPNTFQDLESLPGVGHKTASVIMAAAFHLPAFPVDTHIYRSAKRWRLSKAKTVEGVEKDLKKLFSPTKWNTLHLQIVLYARAFCPAKAHKLEKCPICLRFAE